MAGKRKKVKEYQWSEYQKAIYDFIENGYGNLVVEACAGSGKSSTMLKCIELIPSDKKILMSAFNQDIVNELSDKIGKPENVDVRTLHSLGLQFLKRNVTDSRLEPNQFKYESYVRSNIGTLSDIYPSLGKSDSDKYVRNIIRLVEFGRYYLCQTEKDLSFVEERYDIDLIADEKRVAVKVMEWGKSYLDEIDFTDMVWLPNELHMKPLGLLYDFIFVDECQDMNRAEREMLLKCFRMGTRLISFGDDNQCIYSFAGSDPKSFEKLKGIPNTTIMPLSVSYRCSESIVKLARTIVPSIEPNGDGRKGQVVRDVSVDDITDGSMVLCRNNAPLVQVYGMLLKKGRKARFRGREIGTGLCKVLASAIDDNDEKFDYNRIFSRLYSELFSVRDRVADRHGITREEAMDTQQVQSVLDDIRSLEILSEGVATCSELTDKIMDVFSEDGTYGSIELSTIHKAKGAESNEVFIICPSLMPSRTAKKEWEKRQEENLVYVAYTRARDRLCFVSEDGFEKYRRATKDESERLDRIASSLGIDAEPKRRFEHTKTVNVEDIDEYKKDVVSTTKIIGIGDSRKSSCGWTMSPAKKKNRR